MDSTEKPVRNARRRREKIEKPEKDYEMLQQSLLIALASPYCEISLSKPLTKTKTIPPIFKIQNIKFEKEEMDFGSVVEEKTKQIVSNEVNHGIDENKAKRHSEINRISIAVNMLFDICLELGYFFTLKKSRKMSSTIRIDRIEQVYLNGSLILSKNQVKESSFKAYNILNALFDTKETIVIPQNCYELKEVIPSLS
ncbi:hypothetical protein EHI8A_031970 [Entamoeba histolytica HM-1:IMSS-B]|uniref:Uncharacterized protein n=8 Tax=Entamoeba TaxID=5758 RepID=C4M895_ENTH1|nr:hypothetical protein ENU1_133060 [Entamoeba nuttalli P19]XP_653117.1 hypothetical protein EHI_019080 [Entamoeba histolytica HM-1:IMSS]EMD43784.1 Hypothetical protein EHI5A_022170 [Entamoeba histolytica KU27]EMH74708.1 hypothetical protein EHI8A_031970 [Entamoeba histolytica HM-1:IMSS-B]EMS11113.1 hypothetical protein KM1_051690 [Entamoeba histolytica HM-3:IMSS]ENY60904.1 hypothetical protein EHI7A_021690 [Entamoeba histolytica HM-1:IMSS-A]GAT97802.1 hypothetical protein CL6EHI_019080 [Enta|eukprot:XP_008858334.1 hypothetical protein ENU1_133060 [Entamoeba nuttalli P19]